MIGTDIVEISRIRKVYLKHSERFIDSICTASEKKRVIKSKNIILSLAELWAAKEAVYKLLQSDLSAGIGWHEVKVLKNKKNEFVIRLLGKAKNRSLELNIAEVKLSLTCTDETVMAVAIA